MKYKKLLLVVWSALVFSGIALVPETAHAAGSELCNQLNDKIHILDCGNQDVVTFQGFEGNGLSAPTGQGLDSTLTRAKTAREFIINTVNFALTFLGVIAMVVIIYGGFLYVTAGGEDDQVGKAKKSITYAVIGILIIVASFAIVNTLLNFGGGTNTDRTGTGAGTGRGVGEEGSNIGQQVVYNLGAAEINNSLNDFVSAYKNLSTINGLIKKLNALPAPTDRSDNRNYINQITDFVTQIRDNSNVLSKTHQVAQKMLDEQLTPLQALSAQALAQEQYGLKHDSMEKSGENFDKADDLEKSGVVIGGIVTGGVINPYDYSIFSSNGSKLKDQIVTQLKGDYNLLEASKDDFDASINALIGKGTPPTTRPLATGPDGKSSITEGKLLIVWKVMGAVAEGSTVGQAIQRGFITEKDLANAFSGIDPNENVATLFVTALQNLNEARELKKNPDDIVKLVEAVQSLNRLYIIVKDIKFTYVKINASVKAGNSPLVVELNGLDSRDPTGQTIPNENYVWDPDGDGQDGPPSGGNGFASVECVGTGPSITCTYSQPGTYIVRLAITSKDATHIASGVAYLPITVSPSVARIGLKATVGSISEELRKYEKDSKGKFSMVVDKNEFHVTTQEAKTSGITFDASSSTSGTSSDLKNFAWYFGDGSTPEEGATKNRVDSHKYTREGKYPLKIEVTDNGNRKDRKILNIVIAALAARVGVKQTISEPDTLLEFDGSLSRSDNGAITSYKWSILNKDGDDILNLQNAITIVGDSNGSVLRVRFKQPGNYKVKLEIADSSGTADTQIPVSIKSRKPRANFSVRACPIDCPDPMQPSLIELDASMSFDPDPADVLTYNWSFKNALGEKLEPKTGFDLMPPGTLLSALSGRDAKKVSVKFKSIGKFTISMNVNDSHTDPSILQEDTKEKIVDIASTVEARFGRSMKGVFKLAEGTVMVPFTVSTRNADQLEIEYGDNQSDVRTAKDSPVTLGSDGFITFNFEHEYTEAGAYPVVIKAISESNAGENTLNKSIFISAGDNPLAAMIVTVDGHPATLPKPTEQNLTPAFETIRGKVIKFDASESMDSRGIQGTNNLRFSWSFGDGKPGITGAIVQHSYSDTSLEDKPFVVTLTITEREYNKKTGIALFPIKVVSRKPFANTLSLEKKTAGETTPLDVEVTAEGGADPDGKVTNYQFWYYDPADKENHFAVVDTTTNHAVLTVETNGEENEEHEYVFCVRLTDNENQVTECSDMFSEEELPKLKVKNGANKAPMAEFNPDRTSLKINDSVSFTSASSDSDGKIESYIWDTEGDGFQNDKATNLATISHIYTKKSPSGGYRVKLKVIDDKGAAGYSKEIPIFVSTNSNPPTANFTFKVDPIEPRRVLFFDTSVSDKINSAKITEWKWDFDTAVEYGCDKTPKPASCNGDKTDDRDSTDQNPVFDFPTSGTHQVKLTVEDNNQNTAEAAVLVNVIGGTAGGTGGVNPNQSALKAELKTNPPFIFEMIGGVKKKVIHVPANSNGENVTLMWGDSRGNVQRYEIDKNIYCDSNDDKSRDNDTDNPDTTNGVCTMPGTGQAGDHCWTTNYQRFVKTAHPLGVGHFTTRLKVIDVNSKVDTDSVDIVFDGTIDPEKILRNNDCDGKPAKNLFGASLTEILGTRGIILVSMLLLVGMVLAVWGSISILSRGTRRNV